MGRRKGRKQQKTLISTLENCQIGEEAEERKGEGFFACYLLTSLSPRFKGQTYIGFTVNPRRRIRQHNGEIGSGAWRTKRKRPWEMVLCIYGFPTNVAALQFEWAWQHPVRSLAVRAAAASFKSVSGLANKIKLAYTMLTLPAWQRNACLNDEFEADEEYEVSGSFEASTSEESTEAMRTAHDSPSNHCNFEENMHMQMNQKDNSSCECSEEREHDQRQTFFVLDNDYSVRASSSFVSDSCDIAVTLRMDRKVRTWHLRNRRQPPRFQSNNHFQSRVLVFSVKLRASSSFVSDSCDIAGYAEAGQKCSDVSPDKLSIATLLSDKESFLTEASWHTVSYVEDGQKSSDVAPQKPSTATSVSVKQPFSVEGPSILCKVEVIDILTPSPSYRVNTGSKKRRPAVYPEIIDLTNSPMFV
ncbi:UNVERIFIED_CONTAM: Structure-specific endonuclease subunit SLX1 [Sesamum radiatum]|uniref:Structure-specific endonuclease subunit SLX1 homolog n=1 Tax=Sesamum radiatum TaxID=300843 RepID=A0AAW2UQW0_SESRA